MSATLHIAGTRYWRAASMRRLVFGFVGYGIALLLICIAGAIGLTTSDWVPLIVTLAALLLLKHVISLFLCERLESDVVIPPVDAHPSDFLSASIIHDLRQPTIDGLMLLTAALKTRRGMFLLDEMGLRQQDVLGVCSTEAAEIDVASFIEEASLSMKTFGEQRIDANLILAGFFTRMKSGRTLLEQSDLSDEDLTGILHWETFRNRFCLTEKPWSSQAIRRNASMGRSWVMGYTDELDSLTSEIDTSEHVCGEKSVIIHKDLVDRAVRTLAQNDRRNILLIGRIGTGRRTLVRNIAGAYRSLQRSRHQPFTRILLLHTEKLISGVGNPDTFLLNALSRARKGGTFILVIPDFAALLKSANQNLRTVLMKCLETDSFGVIGIIDPQEYHGVIKADASLDNNFEKMDVDDASPEETMQVLMAKYFSARSRNVHLTYKGMKSILELSGRYLTSNTGMPGKALLVMNDAVNRAGEKGDAFLTEAHVREVISVRSKVNIQRVGEQERERLMNLESVLAKQVIDQPEAIRAVSAALKRARIDLSDRKKPIGTFLFLGPTGVGKTQTAKTLAEEYFGSADAMIRLDMNEYSNVDSVFAITGASSGGDGFLARRVQDRPFSLILLDEIEKAHPSVLNLFLQILDEGFLNDTEGNRTDFRNTIIIATSNAGALFIRDYVREHISIDSKAFKKDLLDRILQDKLFSPEFVNRFDEVVLFYPLSENGIEEVAILMLDDIISDIRAKRGIEVRMDADVVQGLVERGYSIEFGAREMRRTITGIIEDYLADYMLAHDVKRGEIISIRTQDLQW